MRRGTVVLPEELPEWRAIRLLLSIAAQAARDVEMQCVVAQGGCLKSIAWEPAADGSADRPGWIVSGLTSWHFERDSYGTSGNQCTWTWTKASEDTYKKELLRFLRQHDLKDLKDRKGNIVAVPIGLPATEER